MGLKKFLGSSDGLSELVDNLIRVGEVTSINPEAFTARVRFEDRDDIESYDLRLLVRRSLKNKDFDAPDVGEPVLCLFLPTGVEAGFIIGSYYPDTVPRPSADGNVTSRVFEDGTRIEYDRADHRLLIDASASSALVQVVCGTADVQASELISMSAPTIKLDGAVDINGPSLTHNGTDVGSTMRVTGVQPGSGTSGVPV